MRPGSNAIEAVNVSKKCTGLLIREDHPGLRQSGHAALFPPDKNLLDRFVLSKRTEPFILRLSICINGRQLHAIVDLSRKLGNLC
jgi:hypothetical protein